VVTQRRRALMPGVLAAVALGGLLAIPSLPTARAIAIWLVLVAGLVLYVLARDVRSRDAADGARRFEAELRGRPPRSTVPAELLRLERELDLGIANADYAHRRLLRLLRAVAEARLAARRGIDVARDPEAARAVLGEQVWSWLRPDRPAPDNRHAPGIPQATVVAMIERLESL
jgi:hypothetical protein